MSDILIKPLITEKMTELSEKLNTFGFVVAKDANKLQIKSAVEETYGVNVKKVRTMIMPGTRGFNRTPFGISYGAKGNRKKAIITLEEGETIDFYSNI